MSVEAPAGAPALKQSLSVGQLTMMSIGGAIGAGLFVGSGGAVSMAGPAVLIAYLVAGILVILLMFMLGEMAASAPSSGAFAVFAERAMGRVAGTTIGWLYWIQMIIVVAAEATGAAAIVNMWFPALGIGGWVVVFMVVLTAVNLFDVSNYGTVEFWFAALKVLAIAAFLVLGVLILLGVMPGVPAPGLANLVEHGGFMPNGIAGVAGALLIVIFSFGGTEIVAIAAAETANPSMSIRRAVRGVLGRIIVFYLGSVFIIVTVLPWNDPGVAEGPFVAVLRLTQIPGADLIMSIVIVIALLSALNANLYASSRMFFSLAARGNAPRMIARVSARGCPWIAVLCSVVVGFVTGIIMIVNPDENLLNPLLQIIGSTLIVLWITISLSYVILRRRAERSGAEIPFKMWGYPVLPAFALLVLLAIVVLAMTDAGARIQLLATLSLTAVIALVVGGVMAWQRRARNHRDAVTEGDRT